MGRGWQIYYHTLLGTLGAVIGWWVIGALPTVEWNIWLAMAVIGGGLGAFIGGTVGLVEGAVIKRSFGRAALGMFLGGLAGLGSGLLGLLVGEAAFLLIGGRVIGRAAGWIAFGLLLGVSQGVVSLRFKRAAYGLIGGALAGLIGGVFYEVMTQLFIDQGEMVQIVTGMLGLSLLGASLGGVIPLSVGWIASIVADRGTLTVLNGRRQGQQVLVIDTVSIGSHDGCALYLPGDAAIDRKHARVGKRAGRFFVENISAARPLLVGGRTVPPGGSSALQARDEIQLGSTRVRFEAR